MGLGTKKLAGFCERYFTKGEQFGELIVCRTSDEKSVASMSYRLNGSPSLDVTTFGWHSMHEVAADMVRDADFDDKVNHMQDM